MGRRDHGQTGLLGQGRRHQSFGVDANAEYARPVGGKDLARTAIVRIFQHDAITCVQQHARGQRKCLLGAGNHQDVFRRCLHTAAAPQVIADLLAQRWQALCVRIVELGALTGPVDLTPPCAGQSGVGHRQTVLQVEAQIPMLTAGDQGTVADGQRALAKFGDEARAAFAKVGVLMASARREKAESGATTVGAACWRSGSGRLPMSAT